ncbi:MAG: hypothetical protein LUD68_00030, partial [Rikenellaceae bacterium]|nr:hypothetical protein [Rikenellaceae bacterium]
IDSNFVKDNNLINDGVNSPMTNTVNYRNRPFDDQALAIMEAAGIQEPYRDIIPTEEPASIEIYPFVERETWVY